MQNTHMNTPYPQETITAIATAPGRGGVGVIRVSGRGLDVLISGLIGRELIPRHAHFARFRAADGNVLDEGIVLYFPGPNSFTGEDVLELQAHGGPALLEELLARVCALGARRANSVQEYLISQGVAPGRLRTVSYGKERPLAICSDEACYSKNRRAVTVVGPGAGM